MSVTGRAARGVCKRAPSKSPAVLSLRLVKTQKRKDASVGKAGMANLQMEASFVDVFDGVSAAPPRTQETMRGSGPGLATQLNESYPTRIGGRWYASVPLCIHEQHMHM